MKENTYLGSTLENAGNKAKYDAHVKRILSDKNILAWILKYAVSEFKEETIERIVACIEGEPEVSTVQVKPGSRRTEAVLGEKTEDIVPNEGQITYDIRFSVVTAATEHIKLFINVEAQKKYHVGYDLVTRAVFYCARMLSAQMDTEFIADNYDDLKKVYSIWICMDEPEYAKNTITEYAIEQRKVLGDFKGKARYDLLSVIMICLGKDSEEQSNKPLHKNESLILSVRNLMETMGLSLEKACEALKLPIEEYERMSKQTFGKVE